MKTNFEQFLTSLKHIEDSDFLYSFILHCEEMFQEDYGLDMSFYILRDAANILCRKDKSIAFALHIDIRRELLVVIHNQRLIKYRGIYAVSDFKMHVLNLLRLEGVSKIKVLLDWI